eukprot:365690-Chlamydomonas_euryale.AAC.6
MHADWSQIGSLPTSCARSRHRGSSREGPSSTNGRHGCDPMRAHAWQGVGKCALHAKCSALCMPSAVLVVYRAHGCAAAAAIRTRTGS